MLSELGIYNPVHSRHCPQLGWPLLSLTHVVALTDKVHYCSIYLRAPFCGMQLLGSLLAPTFDGLSPISE